MHVRPKTFLLLVGPLLLSVVPLTAVEREAIGEVRGMSREYCAVPLPPAARVVQAERTEGAWVVWYVEKVDAI